MNMADHSNIGQFDLSADLMMSASTQPVAASGSLNTRRIGERRLYDQLLMGQAKKSQFDEAPSIVITQTGPQTFTSASVGQATYAREFATPPSWTQSNTPGSDIHHGFVIGSLSSSRHEATRLNAFKSGTAPLEYTAVPASGTIFYSKAQNFVYAVYKLSASLNLPVVPNLPDRSPSTAENGIPRGFFDATSGSYRNQNYWKPAIFEINIPDYGRIRDIRVWVEFIHDIRGTGSLTSSAGSTAPYAYHGLQGVQVALRSPNVHFQYAHPLWNDPKTSGLRKRPDSAITGSANQFGSFYQNVPDLLRGTYLLWAGHAVDDDLGISLGSQTGTINGGNGQNNGLGDYPDWDQDMDMRTIFWDGSTQRNTRHIGQLYNTAIDTNPGPSSGITALLSGGSPNANAILNGSTLNAAGASAFGLNVPWFYDSRIGSGNLKNPAALTNLSPPVGWLNGPGGATGSGEFPTTGSQQGPSNIQAVYPLLDDIFVQKVFDDVASTGATTLPSGHKTFIGFRPGLRGTEIHGRWQLLIGNKSDFGASTGMLANPLAGTWFRQFRLEFILDKGQEPVSFYPSKQRRFKRPSYVPIRDGYRRVQMLSGSSEWDIGVNYVLTLQDPTYGRSIGITADTGSTTDFAVFTRITGTLADMLTGSQFASTRLSFLNNQFKTPFIPISSGSGLSPAFQFFQLNPADAENFAIARRIVRDTLNSKTPFGQGNTIRDALNRSGYVSSTRDNILSSLNSFISSFTGSVIP